MREGEGQVLKQIWMASGPFDIIGDVHGCCDELEELLGLLGPKRKKVFVGDLVDRGPRVLDTIELVRKLVAENGGHCVQGNHDEKFARWLAGNNVSISHGLDKSIAEIEEVSPVERKAIQAFLKDLPSHVILDDGKLVEAHAGIRQDMIGKFTRTVQAFTLFGDVNGDKDEYGLPIRRDWAARYSGTATIVYGHTPIAKPQWKNRTINIDTGCVFGGSLTALRYPELELVSVRARRQYANPSRPFLVP
jgi:protein phosphatase